MLALRRLKKKNVSRGRDCCYYDCMADVENVELMGENVELIGGTRMSLNKTVLFFLLPSFSFPCDGPVWPSACPVPAALPGAVTTA